MKKCYGRKQIEVEIKGYVAPGFEKVRDAFEANWKEYEVGAGCSVVQNGRTVVDIWGGWLDRECTQPWQENTMVNVYSTTKGMGSLAIAILAAEGKIDYTAKVVDYWLEFGANGKENITVAQPLGEEVDGSRPNLVTGRNMRFARGFSLNSDGVYGKNPNAFGHAGAGGSLGFVDPAANIGFGYAMNQMQANPDDPSRSKLLADAVYDCL